MAKAVKTGQGQTVQFMVNNEVFDMNENHKLFAFQYVKLKYNGTEAAIAAGYSVKTARSIASQLLTNLDIQRLVQALKSDIMAQLGIEVADIAREYMKVGFSDIRKLFNDQGALINVTDLPDDVAGNISSIEVFEEYSGQGPQRVNIGNTKKVKLYDKVNALDKLAKMVGADGVTKIAQTTAAGEDVVILPKKEIHD